MTVIWYYSYTNDKVQLKLIKDSVILMKIIYSSISVEYMHHNIWLIHGRT